VDAELTRATLDALRPVYGGVGIIAEAALPSRDGTVAVRLVLITDQGPRTVVVATPDHNHQDQWVRDRAALVDSPGAVLAAVDDPPMLVLADVD
jgi:hypothetical protein